jgi:hypothetical protein
LLQRQLGHRPHGHGLKHSASWRKYFAKDASTATAALIGRAWSPPADASGEFWRSKLFPGLLRKSVARVVAQNCCQGCCAISREARPPPPLLPSAGPGLDRPMPAATFSAANCCQGPAPTEAGVGAQFREKVRPLPPPSSSAWPGLGGPTPAACSGAADCCQVPAPEEVGVVAQFRRKKARQPPPPSSSAWPGPRPANSGGRGWCSRPSHGVDPHYCKKKMRPPPAPHGWRAERTIGTAQEQRSRGGIIPPGVTPRSDRCIVSHSDKLTKMGAPPTRRKLAHARSGAGPTARAQPRAPNRAPRIRSAELSLHLRDPLRQFHRGPRRGRAKRHFHLLRGPPGPRPSPR